MHKRTHTQREREREHTAQSLAEQIFHMVYQCWFAYKLLLNEIHTHFDENQIVFHSHTRTHTHTLTKHRKWIQGAFAFEYSGWLSIQEKTVMNFSFLLLPNTSERAHARVWASVMWISFCNSMRFHLISRNRTQSVAVVCVRVCCCCLFCLDSPSSTWFRSFAQCISLNHKRQFNTVVKD